MSQHGMFKIFKSNLPVVPSATVWKPKIYYQLISMFSLFLVEIFLFSVHTDRWCRIKRFELDRFIVSWSIWVLSVDRSAGFEECKVFVSSLADSAINSLDTWSLSGAWAAVIWQAITELAWNVLRTETLLVLKRGQWQCVTRRTSSLLTAWFLTPYTIGLHILFA